MRQARPADQYRCAGAVAGEPAAGRDEQLAETPRHEAPPDNRRGSLASRLAHRRHAGEILSMEGG